MQAYDPITVRLHRQTTIFVPSLWLVGQTADFLPEDSLIQSIVWSSHVAFGFALATVIAIRLLWRSTSGRRLPAADTGALHVLARSTHYLLYVLLLVTLALGIANAFIRGYDMYHLLRLPQLGDKDWKKPVTHWHELAANAVMLLALLHASAALVHHYIWRDGLLLRMSPATKRQRELV